MLISDLEHLEYLGKPQNIIGSIGFGEVLSFTLSDGVLSLSLGKEKILYTAIADIPTTGISLSLEKSPGLLIYSSSQSIEGTIKTSLAVVGVLTVRKQSLS